MAGGAVAPRWAVTSFVSASRDVTAGVPEITGHGWITGFASYVVDPTDPFPTGFTVGDIWGG